MNLRRGIFVLALGLLSSGSALAGVLPEDRTDILYHLYEGGGIRIDGPSVLVRKKVGNSTSLVGNYYVDMTQTPGRCSTPDSRAPFRPSPTKTR